MAGRGMGCATRGGGAVEKGPKNKMISETSKKTGPVMMSEGGMMSPRKKMAIGMMGGGMAGTGMMKKGYSMGGVAKKKMMAAGGKRGT